MFKNMDYRDTYSSPEGGNVRYPSTAAGAVAGWAYIYTEDNEYVYGLSRHHKVQIRAGDRWVSYLGQLPSSDAADPPVSSPSMDDDASDPNYEG